MRFLATTALLFAICVAVLLAVSYRLATEYRPARQVVTPIEVEGPAPGHVSASAADKAGHGPAGRWMMLSALLLACVALQGVAVVLARVDRAPWIQLGVTSLALVIWVLTWWLDRLTLTAVAALALAPVAGWQAARGWNLRKKARLAASTPQRNEA